MTELLENGYAMVSIKRGTACGGVCESCGGTCSYRNTLSVKAKNSACATVGDNVTIESSSAQVIGKAAAVYLLPLLAFFLGYFAASLFNASETVEIIVSIVSFFAGVTAVVAVNRRRSRPVDVEIIGID